MIIRINTGKSLLEKGREVPKTTHTFGRAELIFMRGLQGDCAGSITFRFFL